jgi:hypothetical protein
VAAQALTSAVPLLALLAPAAAETSRTWTLPSGITFEMSARELRAARGGVTLFSSAALLAEQKRAFDADAEERARELLGPDPPEYPEPVLNVRASFRPLSVVGPLVSLLATGDGYAPGAAHPYAFQSIEVIDVSRPGAKPSLLDYYGERELVAALLADPWIRRFRDPDAPARPAATLAEVAAALNDGRGAMGEGAEASCDDDAYFSPDLARAFAFHHREGGRVAVRIGIPHGAEVCRGAFHQVALWLPVPAALRADLRRAARREAGFLARDAPAMGASEYSAAWEIDLRVLARTLNAR